jgi:hypothetical protein
MIMTHIITPNKLVVVINHSLVQCHQSKLMTDIMLNMEDGEITTTITLIVTANTFSVLILNLTLNWHNKKEMVAGAR